MNTTLRNLILSVALIGVPAGGFTIAEMMMSPAGATAGTPAAGLGDLSAYAAIVADTQKIAATGDFAAAGRRITDLEALWDKNADTMRAADANGWGVVDAANDAAFKALRATAPDAASVNAALDALVVALGAPDAGAPAAAADAGGAVQRVSGIAVTDANGHALPCEVLIRQLDAALGGKPAATAVAELQTRALERCNADDDTNANALSAQALAQLKG